MKEIYQNYDAVQLATDEDFIRWAKGRATEEDAAWEGWLQRHPEQRAVVEEARSLVQAVRFQPEKPEVDTDQLWRRIQNTKAAPATVKPIASRRRFLFGVAGAAAAAIALVLFFIFGIDQPNVVSTSYEQHLAISLPDQSRVQLNAASQLSYDDSGRRLKLKGEAFFEVEKGSTFTVTTDLGEVQVLGTQFNVFSRDNQFRVQCTEGRVQVSTTGQTESVIITAGMAAVLEDDGRLVTKNLSGLAAEVDWLKDIYRFENQPLRVVFAEMERQFGVEIQASDSILSLPHTGYFERDQLDTALYQVCYPRNLQSKIEGKKVSITSSDTE